VSSRCLSLLIVLIAAGIAPAQRKPDVSGPSAAEASRITVFGVPNFGEATSHLYRGGQPQLVGYKNLKKMGVDIVVDLRLSGRDTEKKNVENAGMKYVAIPWHCYFPKDKQFAEFLTLLRENRAKKIFVHCRYGDDRTGMMIAAYRMAVENWTPEEARKEMEKFGFHKLVCPRLGHYEHDFPEHLKKSSDFKEWRAQVASVSK
jgi:tyrosine-protein phosphatase SIW14